MTPQLYPKERENAVAVGCARACVPALSSKNRRVNHSSSPVPPDQQNDTPCCRVEPMSYTGSSSLPGSYHRVLLVG